MDSKIFEDLILVIYYLCYQVPEYVSFIYCKKERIPYVIREELLKFIPSIRYIIWQPVTDRAKVHI